MKKTAFLFLILAFCLIQLVFAQNETVSLVNNRGYLLGPGDEIKVKVLGEESFDFEAAVDANGNIEVPYAETPVMALCKNEREVRAEVSKIYSKYLRSPQISLRVTDRKSRFPATVGGEIKTPGNVILTRQTRLQEILAFSGGPTEDAGGLIQIISPQPPMCGTPEEISQWEAEAANVTGAPSRMYSLSNVNLGSEAANPIVHPGDLIFVQKAKPIYFTGEVVAPRNIIIPEGGLSLSQGIAMVGGVNREAKTKDVKIYRLKPDSQDRTVVPVNLDLIKKGQQKDVMLEPYDIIEVDKTKKTLLQTILEIATGAARAGAMGGATAIPQRILY
jgi:polysaccharide biosynthesis/export protein